MTGYIQVATTFGQKSEAERLAGILVGKRLAGCVQILGPLTSVYRWGGEIKQDTEYLCLIKSHAEHYAELERTIKAHHPYEVPEILALPISAGSGEYLDWLRQELKDA